MIRFALVLSCLIAGTAAYAADEPAKKEASGSSLERTIDKTGKALGKTADKVEKAVKRDLDRTGEAIDTAGKKTGDWLQKKTGGATEK